MASFWNGAAGGQQLKSVFNRLKPQTGIPNTGTPGGPQAGAPLGGPTTGTPNTGNPNGQITAGPNPLGGPITLTGQDSRGGIPGASGGTGAWERNQSAGGQSIGNGFGAGGSSGQPPFGGMNQSRPIGGNMQSALGGGPPLGGPQISGGGPPNTKEEGGPLVGFPHQWGQDAGGWSDSAPRFDPNTFTPNFGSSQASGGVPDYMRMSAPPPKGIPGAAGGAPGAGGYGSFTATDNMIGSQILPGTDSRQTTAQGYTDSAASGLNSWTAKPFQSVSPYDPSGAYKSLAAGNDQMQGMTTGGYRQVAGTDISGASSWLDRAGQYANPSSQSQSLAGAGGMGGFSYGAETGQSRTMGLDQLKKIMGDSPDRAKLAADSYQLLLDREAPQAAAQDRALAQKTAALGRQGSGMFNSEQMDLATARERTRDQARRELATNAAGLSLSDQLDKLNAAQGFSTAMGGLDTAAGSLNLGYQNANNAERGNAFDRSLALGDRAFSNSRAMANDRLNLAQIGRNDALTERDAMNSAEQYGNSLTQAKANANRQYGLDTYGIGRDLYGDQVSERDKSQAFDQQNFNNLRSKFGDMTGYEQMVRGNGLSDRNEARTERDYQVGQDQRAIDNAVRQRQLEDQYFNSDTRYADTLFGNGYSQNPYSAFANAGNQAAGQASDAWGAAGDLFSNWAKSRATRPTTAPGRPNYGY